jgi:hypothetical protein
MRLLRFAFLISLVLACNSLTMAFDPVIHVDDPQGPGTPVGVVFTFTSDAFGGGLLNFINTSGVTFVNMQIDVPPPLPLAPIACDGNAYVHCFQEQFAVMNFATIDFFGGPGIPDGTMFQIDLGSTGWTPNATFEAFANVDIVTPEPGVLILLATGAGTAWLKLKSRRRD